MEKENEQVKEKVIVIIEGPGGVGKDSIMAGLIAKYPEIYKKIIGFATRKMRKNEKEGDPYYFASKEKFDEMIAAKEFFDYTHRHNGDEGWRGMTRKCVDEVIDNGFIGLKDANMEGIAALEKEYGGKVHIYKIFVTASLLDIITRLSNRGDDAADIAERIADYPEHMKLEKNFDVSVATLTLDKTVEIVHNLIQNFVLQIAIKNNLQPCAKKINSIKSFDKE